MAVPPVIIHFHGIFPYQTIHFWGTPILGNPHISSFSQFEVRTILGSGGGGQGAGREFRTTGAPCRGISERKMGIEPMKM